MLTILMTLACGTTEGTPVGASVLDSQTGAETAGETPVTHNSDVEICAGDAKVELAVTGAKGSDGQPVLVGVKATLSANRGWGVEGTASLTGTGGEVEFKCKRDQPSGKQNRETKVRVAPDGTVENLTTRP